MPPAAAGVGADVEARQAQLRAEIEAEAREEAAAKEARRVGAAWTAHRSEDGQARLPPPEKIVIYLFISIEEIGFLTPIEVKDF